MFPRYRYTFLPYLSFIQRGGDPATRLILAANLLTLLVAFVRLESVLRLFVFATDAWLLSPWTLVTYPLVCADIGNPILVFFTLYWFWVVGGSIERAWSTRTFTGFFAAVSAVSALGLWVGTLVLGQRSLLAGLLLPLAALTVVWCYLNADAVIQFMLVLPIRARHLAWLVMVLVVVAYGRSHPLMGVFALTGTGFALLWLCGLPWRGALLPVQTRRDRLARAHPESRPVRNPFEALTRWRRKRQFQRLWRDSGLPESDNDLGSSGTGFEVPPR